MKPVPLRVSGVAGRSVVTSTVPRRALRNLDDSKLAMPVTGGKWKGKRATEWRLAFYRCDKTGELPILNWPARQVYGTGETKVRLGEHKAPKCTAKETHKPKNPISDRANCTARGTHIDIYQGTRRRA